MPRESIEAKDIKAKRLELARKNRGFRTAEDACTAFGWNLNTYLSHESGIRSFIKSVESYAQAFQVNAGWLMFGESPPNWYSEANQSLKTTFFNMDTTQAPAVSYTDIVDLYYNNTTVGDLMSKNTPVTMPDLGIDKSHRIVCFKVPDDMSCDEFKGGSTLMIDLDEPSKPGDLVIVETPFDTEPMFMLVTRSSKGKIVLKYATEEHMEPIEADQEGVNIMGRVCFIGAKR